MEDVNVHFWLCAGLWNSEVHPGPHRDVRRSSLRISSMILDGIIFSYRGKEDCFRNDKTGRTCLRQLNEAAIAIFILSFL